MPTLNSGNPFAQTVKMGVSSTAAAAGNVIAQLSYVTPANATTTGNVYANANATLANVASVNSILLAADNITVAPFAAGQAYTVTSGNIVMTRNGGAGTSGSTLSAPISFGASTGYVITNDGTLTLSGLITSTAGGLAIAGAGTLSLPNPNISAAGASSYVGTTYLDGGKSANSGTLLLGTNNAIPSGAGGATLINGTIAAATYTSGAIADSSGPVTLTNAITFGASASANSAITFGANSTLGGTGSKNSILFTGAITVSGLVSTTIMSNLGNPANPVCRPAVTARCSSTASSPWA